MIPKVSFIVDGNPVDISGWSCNAILNRGFDNFRGTVRAKDALKMGQHSKLTAYVDANQILWEGRLALDPDLSEGLANIVASGPRAMIEKAAGRLFFQTRDTGVLVDEGSQPHGYTYAQEVGLQVSPGIIRASVSADATLPTGTHGYLFWAPNSTISRFAVDTDASGLGWTLTSLRGTGPAGTLTTIATDNLVAGSASIDRTVAGDSDMLVLRLHKSAGASATGDYHCDLTNLRINGIATSDTYFVNQVFEAVGKRVGYDTTGVRGYSLNVLPLDHRDQWVNLFDYMTVLTDWHWGVYEDRGSGPTLIFEPFEDEWQINRSSNARPELGGFERYNKVIVNATINGNAVEVPAWPATDPLEGRGTNVWEESITDDQPDLTLATAVAETLAEKYAAVRRHGRIDISDAIDPHGRSNVLGMRTGVIANLTDYAPMQNLALRVHEVEYRHDGVSLGIESPVSAAGLMARALLEKGRLPYKRVFS